MNQELMSTKATKGFFRPIDLDLSCDSSDDTTTDLQSMNKSIFRVVDAPETVSPPTFSRANPIRSSIDEEEHYGREGFYEHVITPYPYSPSPQEIEERQHLTTQLGFDWSVREAVPFDDERHEGVDNERETVDYSFYFENVPDIARDVDADDISFVYEEGSAIDDDGFCLDQTEPSSIWERGLGESVDELRGTDSSRLSPAHVSVGSDSAPPSPVSWKK